MRLIFQEVATLRTVMTSDGLTASGLLAFAERQVLAIDGRIDHVFAMPVIGGKAVIKSSAAYVRS